MWLLGCGFWHILSIRKDSGNPQLHECKKTINYLIYDTWQKLCAFNVNCCDNKNPQQCAEMFIQNYLTCPLQKDTPQREQTPRRKWGALNVRLNESWTHAHSADPSDAAECHGCSSNCVTGWVSVEIAGKTKEQRARCPGFLAKITRECLVLDWNFLYSIFKK